MDATQLCAAPPRGSLPIRTPHKTIVHVHATLSLPTRQVTLRCKQRLVFHCGFRRFEACPVFSEDSRRADKHKLERFVQPGRQVIASVYAPALFAPLPLLAFLPADDDAAGLLAVTVAGAAAAAPPPAPSFMPVGQGSLLTVDANRVVIKKIVLTGSPFKCQQRKAVVRWMFYSPEDVRWFKPVELHTKFGRKGAIRDSLGTHGYMKCALELRTPCRGTMPPLHPTLCAR